MIENKLIYTMREFEDGNKKKLYDRVMKDLNYCFDIPFKFSSKKILVVCPTIKYREVMEYNVFNFEEDYKRLWERLFCEKNVPCFVKHLEEYKLIELNASLWKRMEDSRVYLDQFCVSDSVNKLGKTNHRYKALNAEHKLRLKFYKKCGLNILTSKNPNIYPSQKH